MRLALGTLVAALVLLAAAPAHAQTPDVPACTKSGTVISCEVELHEFSAGFHIAPERIDGVVGDTVRIHVINLGPSPHNLLVCGDGVSPGTTCNDKWAGPTKNLGNNESIDLPPFTLKKAGTFYYYCAIPGHAQGGMVGELKVTGGATNKSGGEAALGAIVALAGVAFLVRRR